jgi:hypothetical protein
MEGNGNSTVRQEEVIWGQIERAKTYCLFLRHWRLSPRPKCSVVNTAKFKPRIAVLSREQQAPACLVDWANGFRESEVGRVANGVVLLEACWFCLSTFGLLVDEEAERMGILFFSALW